jgi:hypothetical protein
MPQCDPEAVNERLPHNRYAIPVRPARRLLSPSAPGLF